MAGAKLDAVRAEQVARRRRHRDGDLVTHADPPRITVADDQVLAGLAEVDEGVAAQHLHHESLAGEGTGIAGFAQAKMFRSDADGHFRSDLDPASEANVDARAERQSNPGLVAVDGRNASLEEIHRRRADEAGDEPVGRILVELERRADLLDAAGIHDHDAVGQGHGLDLIVGDVDHRRGKLALEAGDLDTHADAERRVEIGKRLVEEKELGLPRDRASDGDALALAAGELARAAVEVAIEPELLGGTCHALDDLLARRPGDLQAEAHVAIDVHVRVERIGLEDHGDAAGRRVEVADIDPIDQDPAGADRLETGDDAKQRRLPAAGGTDQHAKLAVRNRQRQRRDHLVAAEVLGDRVDRERCHAPPLTFHRAGKEAAHEGALHEDVEEDERQRDQGQHGEERAGVGHVEAGILHGHDGQRLHLALGEHDQG